MIFTLKLFNILQITKKQQNSTKKRQLWKEKQLLLQSQKLAVKGEEFIFAKASIKYKMTLNPLYSNIFAGPMLYQGLKFDFRVYVLLKSVSPLEIYIYKQGLVRFATQKYEQPSKFNLDNLCLHLTNYAVNKLNPKYQFNKTMSDLNYGHKKSLAQFFKSLQSSGCNSFRCWRQIKQCINKTIIAVQPHLHSQYRKAQPKHQSQSVCFQILGFDFMMDQDNKVYLLEVNQSPSFSTETPLDFLIKNFLIKDTLAVVLFDRQKKRTVVQNRMRRFKTECNDSELKNQEQILNEIPSEILGNYELIFPSSISSVQKSYQKMLHYVKADYHKTKFYDNQVSFQDLAKINEKSKSKSPELKIKAKTKEKLSKKYLEKASVLKTKSLSRNVQISKHRNDILGLIRNTRPLSIGDHSKSFLPLIRKQPHSALSPQKQQLKTRKILTLNMTPAEKTTQPHLIQRTLTIPKKGDFQFGSSIYNSQKQIPSKQSQTSVQKKQQQKIENNDNNLLINLSNNQIESQNLQNPISLKILWQKNALNVKKEAFRSELKKYIKYRNPINKIAQQRTQAGQQKQAQKQTNE